MIFHQLKADGDANPPVIADAFEIDSCLRRAWVVDASQGFTVPEGVEVFDAAEAYAFLLRLVCGLESRIAGETDIFGQFKEAWQRFSDAGSELASGLSPWIQKLFEDGKEVRSLYLRSVGGASYGSLVRKLLGAEPSSGETLLIGAGRLAQSVAPFLAGRLSVWNRTRSRAEALARECQARGQTASALAGGDDLARALSSASRAVICVPFDGAADAELVRRWREGGEARRLVHLGGLRSQAVEWAQLEGYVGLDELFDLAKAQDDFRAVQVTRARKACEEKAKLRALGGSSATQHGWEDLAVFAGG